MENLENILKTLEQTRIILRGIISNNINYEKEWYKNLLITCSELDFSIKKLKEEIKYECK